MSLGTRSTKLESLAREDITPLAGDGAHIPLCLQQGDALPYGSPRQPELLDELGDAGDRAIRLVVPSSDPCDQDGCELQPHGVGSLVVKLAVWSVSVGYRPLVHSQTMPDLGRAA